VTDDQIYEDGLAIERLQRDPGWGLVESILTDIKATALEELRQPIHVDALIVKGRVNRWQCIEGLVGELAIRMSEIVKRKDDMLIEAATTVEPPEDPRIREAIQNLEPTFEEEFY